VIFIKDGLTKLASMWFLSAYWSSCVLSRNSYLRLFCRYTANGAETKERRNLMSSTCHYY